MVPTKACILVVDDEIELERLIKQRLRKQIKAQEFEFLFAHDGKEALDILQNQRQIDLILADINMPEMDGLTLLELLPQVDSTLKAVVMSAYGDIQNIRKAMNGGAFDFLTKPIDFQDLEITIKKTLNFVRQTREQRHQLQQAQLQRELYLQEMIRAKEAAESANRAKSIFLANMSHELRTPLNAILGFTQIMSFTAALEQEQQEYLDIINRSGQHLLKLINDVLEMSKIEAGRVKLTETNFDLYRLLDSLEEMLRLKATAKHLKLIFERAPIVPRYVFSDESKLCQVLLNLLDNAIKFTQAGRVTLRVRLEQGRGNREQRIGEQGGRGVRGQEGREVEDANLSLTPHPPSFPIPHFLLFEVEDTGPGMPPEDVRILFGTFVQTRTGQHFHGGTGLGLAISRQFVNLMGGDITVHSVVGRGSVFRFNIQVHLSNPTDLQTQMSTQRIIGLVPDQPVYRLLIVEDNKENSLFLMRLLSSIGFEVREGKNGQEGLDLWEHWHPHLIFMDMRMPVMSGYEATQRIKATAKGQTTVIIAVTSSAFEEDRSAILSIGCDDFISKPFQEEIIFAKLADHLGIRYLYEADPQPSTPSMQQQEQADDWLLNAESLEVMQEDWINQLHQAACGCSDSRIFQLIEQIPETHTSLAKALHNLADNFQFEEILALTAPARAQRLESN
jgi:signal transduction histidine kinase